MLPASDAPVKQYYLPLSDRLSSNGFYEEVSLDDFAPDDRYTRRHWMDKLSFPYRTMVYRCPYGNHLGVISFIWKVPDDSVDQTQIGRLITKFNER